MTASDPTAGRIDLTPMIDIVFLLLVFFILACSFREPNRVLDAHLPRGGDCPPCGGILEDARLTLRAPAQPGDAPGVLLEYGEQRFSGAHLLDKADPTLAGIRRSFTDPGVQGVVIVSEGRVKFGLVMKGMNAARRAGIRKVHFAAAIAGSRD